ncbi:hypothetical protein COU14_01085 [Candidatus Kaiserbacteria bacterium CG10_big_fil_rev_8_21_14_0_10_44_10]|uniref:Type II secretion system protein GspG C-terminal domain-containing protein n=1 Tax=Candidatus Kaiserbacteria bacterium CG10_big_fil_rev_8_21_14_0_10_44_10 TaxID=1974606 RepID=A0A2H0UI71_9BACT|nr:MAG: hypothetical protein COU14_01085 [Candidatus Kaiserbacteria bacterium CG10_big_fil_rev_8_21_14_0_10_44_10]
MVLNKNSAILIEFTVAAIIMFSFAALVWWLFDKESDVTDAQLKGNMVRLQASAETYYSRMTSYDGVCADIGLPPNFNCTEDDDVFAIETQLSSGKYLCLDKKGFLGEVNGSKKDAATCSGAR